MRWLYCMAYIAAFPFFYLFHWVRVIGRENIPEGGALICANHSASSDPVCLLLGIGLKYHVFPMAKAELLQTPVLGPILRGIGVFGVARGKSDIGAIKTALKHLKGGDYVLIFPEGTRVHDDQDVSAKNGAAMLALRTGVPVVPVYVPREKHFLRPIEIVIGKPYKMEVEGKATSADYARFAGELLDKIYSLGEKTA